jgi:hypothetical protein
MDAGTATKADWLAWEREIKPDLDSRGSFAVEQWQKH